MRTLGDLVYDVAVRPEGVLYRLAGGPPGASFKSALRKYVQCFNRECRSNVEVRIDGPVLRVSIPDPLHQESASPAVAYQARRRTDPR